MATVKRKPTRRASITLMIVGLLAMLFVLVSAYITLARFDRVTSLKYGRAQDVAQAIDSINDLVLSMMKDQFVDADGELFGGAARMKDTTGNGTLDTLVGGQFADVPGHAKSRFGGGLEPFFDFAATSPVYGLQPVTALNYRRFVTSTGPKDGTESWGPLPGVSIRDMVASQSFSETAPTPRPLFDGTFPLAEDWAQLARRPFMDADGDGVPDASFEHTANLQELVNAVFGRIVRAPTENEPNGLLLWREMWQRFDLSARFEVAVRVVPHSGMVALDSYNKPPFPSNDPVTRLPFNRVFVREMFQWVRADNRNVPRAGNSFYNEVHLNRRAIEPLLRRRGGMLASWRDGRDTARIPDVLRDMERDYPNTFVSNFGRNTNEPVSQRFNIAASGDGGEGIFNWGNATRLHPPQGPTPYAQELDWSGYDRRHLITTASTSDELARPQEVAADSLTGISPGQLKFYLGRIQNRIPAKGPVLFDWNTFGTYNQVGGDIVVRELANVFFTMLAGHQFPSGQEQFNRHEQAIMLAVNTVAFAAPRSLTNGWIDVVSYVDPAENRRYVGYSPQPFFSEAILYWDRNAAGAAGDYAVGIEIHNPNEPLDALAAIDSHALDLSQFWIGFNGVTPSQDPNAFFQRLSQGASALPPLSMNGRTTLALAIRQAGNNVHFDNVPRVVTYDSNLLPVIETSEPGGPDRSMRLVIDLWKESNAGGLLYRVDSMVLEHSDAPSDLNIDWFATTQRDTTDDGLYMPADLFLGEPAPPLRTARWGVAVGVIQPGKGKGDAPPGNPDEAPETGSLGNIDFGFLDFGATNPLARFAPAPPLYTMNAGAYSQSRDLLTIHDGDGRPTSFPTPGFMLFVPRFASVDGAPVTASLGDQWVKKTGFPLPPPPGYRVDIDEYPADFGHMAIVDNSQVPLVNGAFNQKYGAGSLPWGLLVFDYFTTIDPDRIPGGDPLRVPGRININAAPWYVMAGLPVIRPAGAQGRRDLPLAPQTNAMARPSAAFWSNAAGVLVGNSDPTPNRPFRFDINRVLDGVGGRIDGVWNRLGTRLALEAVSYRDRVAYVNPDPGVFSQNLMPVSFNRNDVNLHPVFGALPQYRNLFTYGTLRRESELPPLPPIPADTKKYGFVSIGELLNVKGFDTAVNFNGVPDSSANEPMQLNLSEVLHYDPAFGTGPDFMKAVSLMALLETQFLTTRGNTFTVYVTVFDRENPQASVRSQITVDRGNTLPKLSFRSGIPIPLPNSALPEIIAERRIGYFNTIFDD